jgi:hypothetical protein
MQELGSISTGQLFRDHHTDLFIDYFSVQNSSIHMTGTDMILFFQSPSRISIPHRNTDTSLLNFIMNRVVYESYHPMIYRVPDSDFELFSRSLSRQGNISFKCCR